MHIVLPDDSPPELKESFDALRAPLLLNSALAAVRIQPPFSENGSIAVKSATRALSLQLSTADKGTAIFLHFQFSDTEDVQQRKPCIGGHWGM